MINLPFACFNFLFLGDTALLRLILKEVQDIKKKAAVERQEINLKLDKVMTFYYRLSRFLLPNDKKRILSNDMPSYPLKTEEEMKISEEFLKNNENFCFLVCFFFHFALQFFILIVTYLNSDVLLHNFRYVILHNYK